jgi:hypothetical protein
VSGASVIHPLGFIPPTGVIPAATGTCRSNSAADPTSVVEGWEEGGGATDAMAARRKGSYEGAARRPSQTRAPMILTLANPREGEIRFSRASINF